MSRVGLVYMGLCVLIATGCATNSYEMVTTSHWVGYTVASSASLDREPPPVPPDKATQAITHMKRVAFFPPDECLDLRAGETSTKVDKQVLRLVCGVTMSELEREAERVGFDVVTWQSLKGPAGTRPIELAKEAKIDLLFEVNELDVVQEGNRSTSAEFKYFEGDANTAPIPYKVSAQDNAVCKAFNAKSGAALTGLTAVLDIKMVQVSTGSVLWIYRHEENVSNDEKSGLVRFAIMGKQTYATKRPWWPWAIVGAGVAIGLLGEEYVIGGVISGIGAAAAIIMPKKTEKVGAPEPEPYTNALCKRAPIIDVILPKNEAPVMSDTWREDHKWTTKNFLEEQRRELIKKSVGVFMAQLTGRPMPQPAPPAPPPAPAPASGAPGGQ